MSHIIAFYSKSGIITLGWGYGEIHEPTLLGCSAGRRIWLLALGRLLHHRWGQPREDALPKRLVEAYPRIMRRDGSRCNALAAAHWLATTPRKDDPLRGAFFSTK